MQKSFANKISIYVILLTALLFILTSLTVYRLSYSLVQKEAVSNAYSQLKALKLEMENVLNPVSTALDNIAPIAEKLALSDGDTTEFLSLISSILTNTPHLTDIALSLEPYQYHGTPRFTAYAIKAEDTVTSFMIHREFYDYIYYDWYVIPRCTGRSYWTDPYIDRVWENLSLCSYSIPLKDKNGRFLGVICASIETDWITRTIDSIKLYEHSYNFVLGKAASFIVHPDPEFIINETIFTQALLTGNSTLEKTGRRMISGETGMERITIGGKPSMIFFTPVESNDWSIATVCPESDIFSGVYRISRTMAVIAVLTIIIMALVVGMTIRKATGPLTLLAGAADKISEGDFNSPLPPLSGDDEVGRLCRSFSSMQYSLSSYMERLQRTTAAKERIESELNIAREIQMGMVPKIFPPFPERDDVDIYAILNPAREIGGDLYDFFISGNRLYFAIGDVSGKGVPASLLMAVTCSHFRSVSATAEDPGEIVTVINTAISETNEANMFVTFFTGILDLRTGSVTYCNAGHNPPLILNPDGTVTRLSPEPNLPMGFFESYRYTDGTFSLTPGAVLLMYTDGLTEAENSSRELYGNDRLEASLRRQKGRNAKDIVDGIYEDAELHVAGAVQSDDMTLLCIRFNGSADSGRTSILTIHNQVSELTALADFVSQTCSGAGVDNTLTMSINLALEEAVSNVIFYAYPKGETDHNITVKCTVTEDALIYTIFDRGIPFDPTSRADADVTLSAEERKIGGLGIFLVRQIMDKTEYQRRGNENILTLTKYIK